MARCKFEVRFRQEVEGARAKCSFCDTTHVYSSAGTGRLRWLTMAEYEEVYIPDESLLRVEDVYREINVERKVHDKQGVVKLVPEQIVIADHAPWCGSPDVPIAGLTAKVGGPGRIRWRDSKGVIRHNCVSSAAARKHGVISGEARANTAQA
ncbi:MAG: hypothetical protein IIA89_02065 [Chloroflexi bacterium]|nr:hypothetical protein [Chloroflexota bacterium]